MFTTLRLLIQPALKTVILLMLLGCLDLHSTEAISKSIEQPPHPAIDSQSIPQQDVSDPNIVQQMQLTAPKDANHNDRFGQSVALSGDGNTALIGAGHDDHVADDAGAAYIFIQQNNAWHLQAKLIAPDAAAADRFGVSVALSSDGNTALIGAPYDKVPYAENGSAYLYTRTGSQWTFQHQFTGSGGSGARFGISLALNSDGTRAIIGAPREADGVAYVYSLITGVWAQSARITPVGSTRSIDFGASVSLNNAGDWSVIGAPSDNVGAAYVFRLGGDGMWQQAQRFTPFYASEGGAAFGRTVALSADGATLLVGAMQEKVGNAIYAGAAYVYRRTGEVWSESAHVVAPEVTAWFGTSVAVNGDGSSLFIGGEDNHISNQLFPTVYRFIYDGTTWVYRNQVRHSLNHGADFGDSVAVAADGITLLVGAPGDYLVNTAYEEGSAWTYGCTVTCTTPLQITADQNLTQNDMGTQVAINQSGDYALVGAKEPGLDGFPNRPAIYVFARKDNLWNFVTRFYPNSLLINTSVESLVLSGEGSTLLVGMVHSSSPVNPASVAVFVRNGSIWQFQTEFTSASPTPTRFGRSTAVSHNGNTALIGAPQPGVGTGSVLVYTRTGAQWTLETTLVSTNPQEVGTFGSAVALDYSGSTALVSAPSEVTHGYATVFSRTSNGWVEGQTLTAPLGDDDAGFGDSLSLSDNGGVALIGAPRADHSSLLDAGIVYAFSWQAGSWALQQRLMPNDPSANANFGERIVLTRDGNSAYISAPHDDSMPNAVKGSVYHYVRGWQQNAKLTSNSIQFGSNFGRSVATSADARYLIIAALDTTSKGLAFVLRNSGISWSIGVTGNPNLVPGATLTLRIGDSDVNASALPDSLWLVVSNARTNEFERVLLTETGPSTGVFSGELGTVNAPDADGFANQSINVLPSDQIVVSYYDFDYLGVFLKTADYTIYGLPTQIQPVSTYDGDQPDFVWTPVYSATDYYLWVDRLDGTHVFDGWFEGSAVCVSESCTTNLGISFKTGEHQWWVQAFSPSFGYGPWTSPMQFIINIPLETPILLTPEGSIPASPVTLQWQKVVGATWYYVWLSSATGHILDHWYPAPHICQSAICSIALTQPLEINTYRWWVQAWSPISGHSAWSTPLDFTVSFETAPTPVSPSGLVDNASPLFNWTQLAAADWYQIWISTPNGDSSEVWFESSNVCAYELCTAQPLTIKLGLYRWWVRGWSSTIGYSPWSAETHFMLPLPAPTPIAPIGSIATDQPAFAWTLVGADWYYLWISGEDGHVLNQWFASAGVCDSASCLVIPLQGMPDGSYEWWIQAWSPIAGYSAWSASTPFDIGAAPLVEPPLSQMLPDTSPPPIEPVPDQVPSSGAEPRS